MQEFERVLKQSVEVDFEYVFLHEYNLEFCRGCLVCFNKGEQLCPLRDDRDLLLEKLEQADGVLVATPNYAFHVSARVKNLLDRLAFIFHRPQFFGKTYTALVVQGFLGGNDIRKYLESTGKNFGFDVVKGTSVTTHDPMTEKQQEQLMKKVHKVAERFKKQLMRSTSPSPSFLRLVMFRITRNMIKGLDPSFRDHQHFEEQGWFESDYYYETSLGLGKRMVGRCSDLVGRRVAKNQ